MDNLKRIKYFTYYGCNVPQHERNNSPAADSKIDYIIEALNKSGYAVDLISQAPSSCGHFIKGTVIAKGVNTLRYFTSFGSKSTIICKLNYLFMKMQFFLWCLRNVKKGEQVIVYHSLGYDAAFIKLSKLKNIRIVGEIEEIYQDVHQQRKSRSINEYKFLDVCSKYIFPTSLLNEKINTDKKPSVVVHGIYTVEQIVEDKFNDGKTHVVYGGTLDPNKGGAAAAAAAAAYLPEDYHIHICGFGDSTQIKSIIADISKSSKAKVTFEGELKGESYKRFIQKCHIGLSTQNPQAAFNATSFPSKILVYLSNGLKVVSINIPAIKQSDVADCIHFYNEQTPHAIAAAIENATKEKMADRDILKELDNKFVNNVAKLLEQ